MTEVSKNEAKARAGRMGVAVREAKKEAEKYGKPIFITEFEREVLPDGTVIEKTLDEYMKEHDGNDLQYARGGCLVDMTEPDDAEAAPAEKIATGLQEATEFVEAQQTIEKFAVHEVETTASLTQDEIDALKEDGTDTVPDVLPSSPNKSIDNPNSVLGWANFYKAKGLDDDEAMTLANKKMNVAAALGQERNEAGIEAAVRQHDMTGPDPRLVAEYQERMKTYVPPVLDKEFTIVLPIKFADWVTRFAAWESAKRNEAVSVERAIDIIVREHWRDRATMRAVLEGTSGGTGPTATFDPKSGTFK